MAHKSVRWLKQNLNLVLTGLFSLAGFVAINHILGWFNTGISPEFIGRAIVKLFYIVCSALISVHSDRWLAPSLAKYVEDLTYSGKTEFEMDWENGDVKRPVIALSYYVSIFIGLIIAFSL